jgi:hypothetical protein
MPMAELATLLDGASNAETTSMRAFRMWDLVGRAMADATSPSQR